MGKLKRVSSDFGGGAAGLVPYHLHDNDCNPVNGAWQCPIENGWPTIGETETLVLSFYGPVLDGTYDSTPPVIVEWRDAAYPCTDPPTCTPPAWDDITDDCIITVAPTGHPREVWIQPGSGLSNTFGTTKAIRVIPRATDTVNDLRCDQTLLEEPPPVADFEYFVTSLCSLDLNRNGSIDGGDLEEWASDPVDLNGDGYANQDDALLIINAI